MLIYYCVPDCSLRELDLELIYMRGMTIVVVYCVMDIKSESLIWGGSSVGSSWRPLIVFETACSVYKHH